MLTEYPILPEQLVIGLFVRFEFEGQDHPWQGKAFKIENERQIEEIRAQGFAHVVCVLNKSDRLPLPVPPPPAPAAAHAPKTPVYREIAGIRGETIERNRILRERFERTGRKYHEAMDDVANMLKRMAPHSSKTMEEAERVVGGLTTTFLSEGEVVVGLMASKAGLEERPCHALNVSVLSMILGRELSLAEPDLRAMGLAAVFHDVGKGRVPMGMMTQVSTVGMNRAVKKLYREHPTAGARIVAAYPNFPAAAGQAIAQHHEHLDGTGFPAGLRGAAVSTLARMPSPPRTRPCGSFTAAAPGWTRPCSGYSSATWASTRRAAWSNCRTASSAWSWPSTSPTPPNRACSSTIPRCPRERP